MDIQQEIIFRQIGAKVAYYRTLRGITQEKLAEKMGLPIMRRESPLL